MRLPFPYGRPSIPAAVEPPAPKRTTGADYDTEWARRYPARLARVAIREGLMRPAVSLLASPQRNGLDRLSQEIEPVIFAANHHSHVDTLLMMTSIPEPWRSKLFVVAAADYFFRNRVTAATSALVLGAIPFERTRVSRKSLDQSTALLGAGWSMLIFPEGGRSPDGWGQPHTGGAAFLALRCGVPVIPVHLEGTGRILPKGKRTPTPSRTTVTFGAPLWPAEGEDSRRFAARIERTVAALADEQRTDWYAARVRAHRAETPSLTGPQTGAWRRAWALPQWRRANGRQRRWP